MQNLLPFIVSGLVTGSIYGLAGTGLLITYKTSGIFNFAQGAVGTVAVYVFYWMHVQNGWNWELSAVASVLVLGVVLGLIMERLARMLAEQLMVYQIAGMIGLVILVESLAILKYGNVGSFFPPFLPGSGRSVLLGGVSIGYTQIVTFAIAVAATAGVSAYLRFTRTGLAMRAVVDDPDLLDLQGNNPARVRRIAWVAGSIFATLSSLLVAPEMGLEPTVLTLLVVQAFGATAIGGFSNIPATFAGGLLIGIVTDVSRKYVLSVGWLAGLPDSLPFIMLVVMLLVLFRRRQLTEMSPAREPKANFAANARARLAAGGLVLAVLAVVPFVVGHRLSYFTVGLSIAIVILSLGLLVRTSGQISLCHSAFMGIGACAFYQFRVQLGLPWGIAVVLAALIAVPIGALIAVPAIRLSGLFLALITLAFGIMITELFYPLNFMFGELTTGRPIPRPDFAGTDRAYYFLVLGIVAVVALVVVSINQGRLGRLLRGMRGAPLAISTLGLNTNSIRVTAFCVSAFLAALGGVLYGGAFGYATSSDPTFGSFYSLVLLASLAIAFFREPWYVLPGMVAVILPAYWTAPSAVTWLNAIFGAAAVLVAASGGPPVMPARVRAWLRPIEARPWFGRPAADPGRASGDAVPGGAALGGARGLEVAGVSVRFGGIAAVDGLSLRVPAGRITGLIGPNGAGKTTTFAAISGLVAPAAGVIRVHGQDITGLSPSSRALRGLGRTFQRMQLCDGLTVAENVWLGREAGQAGHGLAAQIISPLTELRQARAAAGEAMELCGIADLAGRQVAELSTGQRRLVEFARCLAGQFDVLLLDEPSSGLDRGETEQFGDLLVRVQRQRSCSVLLVEHDMGLVMRVCDYLYVLDFGRLLFEGEPGDVAGSAEVRGAYLGDDDPSAPALRRVP
jgi:ABC-type branched-subunit amino acid transport system ATPase component/branched-subunit amino acid ABC-type transport system permease component